MDIKNEWLHSKRFNKEEEVKLTGLRFRDGTIDFWTVDKNDHITEDLTYEVTTKPGNPDKEVAVSSVADTEFLKENGLIKENPNSSFENGNSTYYVYSLTEKGLSAADQLPIAKERNIDAFYAVFDQNKDCVSEVIYAENEEVLWERVPELERYQYVIPVKDAVESGLGIPQVEIDHGYTLNDLIYDIELEGFDYQKERKAKDTARIDFALSEMGKAELDYLDLSNQKKSQVDKMNRGEEIDISYYDSIVISLDQTKHSVSDMQKEQLQSLVSSTEYNELSEGISRKFGNLREKEMNEVYEDVEEVEESQELGK